MGTMAGVRARVRRVWGEGVGDELEREHGSPRILAMLDID